MYKKMEINYRGMSIPFAAEQQCSNEEFEIRMNEFREQRKKKVEDTLSAYKEDIVAALRSRKEHCLASLKANVERAEAIPAVPGVFVYKEENGVERHFSDSAYGEMTKTIERVQQEEWEILLQRGSALMQIIKALMQYPPHSKDIPYEDLIDILLECFACCFMNHEDYLSMKYDSSLGEGPEVRALTEDEMEDINSFIRLIVKYKTYLVPIEMVDVIAGFAEDQGYPFHGGMITDSGKFQFLYYEG